MTRYFAINTLAAAKRSNTAVTETTTAGRFNATHTNRAIAVENNNYFDTINFAATGTLWLRFDIQGGAPSGSVNALIVFNGGNNVFRLLGVTGGNLRPQYWNGSAWTTTGSDVAITAGVVYAIVIRIDLNSGFEMWRDNVSVSSATGWTGGATAATFARYSSQTVGPTYYSQLMGADYDLRGSYLKLSNMTGNGDYTDGTGVYTDVEKTGVDDTTVLLLDTVGDKRTFDRASISLDPGYVIATMVVSARGRVSGAVADGAILVRSDTTDEVTAGEGFTLGFEPRQVQIDNDPDTATTWTLSGYNAAQVGLEAI